MSSPIRPVNTFVVRVWHEPGDSKADDGWRGIVRPLNSEPAQDDVREIPFVGLDRLLAVLRPLLDDQT